jgi:hypothetical protein
MTPAEHEEVLLMQVFDQFDLGISKPEGAPITWILAQAQAAAMEAMKGLIDIDPENAKGIRMLQNEVQRNRDLTEWMRKAVISGHEIYQRMTRAERDFVPEFADESESGNDVEED